MSFIQIARHNYGLTLNWHKLELLPVRCEADIVLPDGTTVDTKESIVYLGSLLSRSGEIGLNCAGD